MVKWAITKYQHSWVDSRLLILVWTDLAIHAFLNYSLEKELFAYITSERRGIRRLVKPLWELPGQIIIEQAQHGDTLSHAFYIPAIPDQATLTFFISATHEGIEAKSVSIPIKIQHPHQDGADPVDCPDISGTLLFIPWQSNYKDAVGIHDDIWNVTGMTGSGYFAYGMNQLSLIIGPDAGSVAQIYAGDIFDLGLDHTLKSQLRAIVKFPGCTSNTLATIAYGRYGVGSGYGFRILGGGIDAFTCSNGWTTRSPLVETLDPAQVYLLEAKLKPGEDVQFWLDGEYIHTISSNIPSASDISFFAYITDPDTPSVAIHFRRFMIWKQSIWTGAYYEG